MKLGYLLPTRERIVVGKHATGPIIALGDHAENVGLDSVWIGDSLLAKPRHEPLALIAAIGARTSRITLGTGILLPMLRNPVLLAQQCATIDQITEGRMILGLGIGRDIPAIRREFEAAGVPFEKRVGRMLDQIKLCRALWSGDVVNWDGYYTVREAELAPRPYTDGGPAFWGGGGVPGALKRAGRYFDGWLPSGAGTPQEWKTKWSQVLTHAAEVGRDTQELTGAAYVTVAINDDMTRANAELDSYLHGYYNQDPALIRQQQYCFAGTEAATVEWLKEFVEAGATHLVVRFTGDQDERQMDTLAGMKDQLAWSTAACDTAL